MSAILQLLRLDHLSAAEKESIITLVETHSDRFYMPNEYLNKTHLQTHKIVTLDHIPVHYKQNRFLLVHRNEIIRQVQQSLDKNILTLFMSLSNSSV